MPTIAIKGIGVAFTGKIKGYTKQTLTAHISAMGGYPATSVNSSHGVFLAGDRAAEKKIDKARALGVPVVTGEQLYELLEKGEIEFDDSKPTRPLAELIGDARALFDEAPSHESWAAICALADECDDDHIDDFVAYLTPQLDAWPRVLPGPARRGYQYTSGIYAHAGGDLRYFPEEWLTKMVNGDTHPKHALCTAVTYAFVDLNSTLSTKLLDNPAMRHVRTFDIGYVLDQSMKKKTFYKAMAACENLDSVETLIVAKAPVGALDVLAKASSMPNLTRILIRHDVYESRGQDDMFAGVFFGPWAERLELVGVTYAKQLEVVADRLGELPALRALALGSHARTDQDDFVAMAAQLARVVGSLDELHLCVASLDDYQSNTGLGALLDAVDSSLSLLDMSACTMSAFAGEAGKMFFTKHVIENGVAGRIQKLVVNDLVEASIVAYLRGEGVDVEVAGGEPLVSPAQEQAASDYVFVEELADGEDERVTKREVHPHDAMMFSSPSSSAWETLVSVVDGLEVQLDPAAFEVALGELAAYLEPWPNALRVMPKHWVADFLADSPSPKIALVRSFRITLDYDYPKGTARQLTALAQAGNLEGIEHVSFTRVGKQKYFTKAVGAFFGAAKPREMALNTHDGPEQDAILAAIEGAGASPERVEFFSTRMTSSTDHEALSLREVDLEIKTPEQLQRVLSRQDLDHVVSLSLKLRIDWEHEHYSWSSITTAPASFRNLRHLDLSSWSFCNRNVWDLVVSWLSRARPVHISDLHEPDASNALALAGVYSRTYGSKLVLPSSVSITHVRELLSTGYVRVGEVALNYGPIGAPGLTELIDAMHASTRAGLRRLRWITSEYDAVHLDELLERLGRLQVVALRHSMFALPDSRAAMIAAIAASESSRRLGRIDLVHPYQPKGFTAAELKRLDKGKGAGPGAVFVSQRMES